MNIEAASMQSLTRHIDFEFISFFTVFIIGIFSLCAGLVFLIYTFGKVPECEAKAAAMNIPHKITFRTGCMVQIKGRWVPIKAIRVVHTING